MSENLTVSVSLKADGSGLSGALRISKDELAKLRGEAGKANDELKQQSAIVRTLSKDISGLKSAIAGLGLGLLVRDLAGAATQMQGFQSALQFATGTVQGSQQALAFVRNEANRLGIDFKAAAQSYTQLAAAARGTSLEGEKAQRVFSAVAEASRVLNLSSDQTAGAINALQQMISKGTVSSEELKQQLGERLPGAFQIAARAMGVTTQQLNKMLEDGEVLADEFLPRFADEVTKTFAEALPSATQTASAEFARFGNAVDDLKVAFGTALLPVLTDVAKYLTDTLIPTAAWAADQLGVIARSTNSMSDGELRQRQSELRADVTERFQLLDTGALGADRRRKLEEENQRDLARLAEIGKRIAKIDELNKQIIELGREGVDALKRDTRAVAEYLQGYAGEREKAWQATVDGAEKAAKAAAKAQDKIDDAFKRAEENLTQQIELSKESTNVDKIRFETEHGSLVSLSKLQKQRLLDLAQELDIKEDLAKAAEESAEVHDYLIKQSIERERDWEKESARLRSKAIKDAEKEARDLEREREREAERQAEQLAEPFNNALRSVQSSFADAFEQIFSGGVKSFGDLGKQIKAIFVRLASELAALMVIRPIIEGVSGAFGMGGSRGGGISFGSNGISFGGGGGSSGLFSGGFNLSSLFSGMQSEFGASVGIGIADMLGAGAWGQSFGAGAGLNAPWAMAGGVLNSVLGIDNGLGSMAGGLIGGGLGSTLTMLGSFGGPIGAVAGTVIGGLISGLFSGKPKRKVSAASVFQPEYGQFSVKDKGGPGGSSAARGVGAMLARELNALTAAGYKLNFNGGFGFTEVTNADKAGGQPFYLDFLPAALRPKGGFQRQGFDSAQALVDAVLNIVKTKGVKETPEQAAEKERAKEILKGSDAMRAYRDAVDAVIKQFADLRKNAKDLGLSISEINRAERSTLTAMKGGYTDQIRGLVQQGRQMLGIDSLTALQKEMSFGSLSNTNPMGRFNAAQAEFRRVARLARRGDAEAIQNFGGVAQEVLTIGRDTFASGPEYQALFREVNTTLNTVLTRQRELERQITAGLTITLRETSADQVAAIREQTTALKAALARVEARLRKVA